MRAVTADVIAGRMTLREAAGHFRLLDGTAPWHYPDDLRPSGDERAYYGRVIGWVRGGSVPDCRHLDAVLDRLRAEYRQRFGYDPVLSP